MPTAFDFLPDRFEQLGDARAIQMRKGLERVGYTIKKITSPVRPDDERDVLITWTIHRGSRQQARDTFEAGGGRVIVAEESHLKGIVDRKMFSLQLHGHNGEGYWYHPESDVSRWQSFGIELQPWREGGKYVLVAGQRGIGSTLMASPDQWHYIAAERVGRMTSKLIRVRPHPKSRREVPPTTTLDEDLAEAFAVVVWSSGVGTRALIEGIPVFYDAPHFFLQDAARSLKEGDIDNPPRSNRLSAFGKFAWSQWFAEEIESGEAFWNILS